MNTSQNRREEVVDGRGNRTALPSRDESVEVSVEGVVEEILHSERKQREKAQQRGRKAATSATHLLEQLV